MQKTTQKIKKKIVVIGGGTGVFSVLKGLKNYFPDLTAIITMADDGGSTGILREEFGVLPPGDVRRALIALSETDNKILSDLFNYRFERGNLSGHSFGNLFLTALEKMTGDFEKAIEEAGKILTAKGKVIPITLDSTRLIARLENGKIISGETNIDIPKHDGRLKIEKIWLKPSAKINPRAEEAIVAADIIIIGPGDLYTSIIPNFLVQGAAGALKKSKAKKVYFVNLMTKFGETNDFSALDFWKTLEKYIGPKILDYVIINNKKPVPLRLKKYVLENASVVNPPTNCCKDLTLVRDRDVSRLRLGKRWNTAVNAGIGVGVKFEKRNFPKKPVFITTDLLRSRGFVRHDPKKIAKIIKKII